MLRSCVRWLLAGLLVLLSTVTAYATQVSSPRGMVRIPGHELPALAKATVVPSTTGAEGQPITLTIVLKRDNQPAFDRYLNEIYDSHSKNFHHYLSQREIADRFGPSRKAYESVLSYLRQSGFHLVRGSKNRMTITIGGTRRIAERAFDVRIDDYRLDDKSFYANAGNPALPPGLANRVQAVNGLSDLAQPHNVIWVIRVVACKLIALLCAGTNPAAGAEQTVWDACFAATNKGKSYDDDGIYNVCATPPPKPTLESSQRVTKASPSKADSKASSAAVTPLPWEGIDGTGQTIGLVEFDNFVMSDVQNYLAFVNQPASLINNLSVVDVNGGTGVGAGEAEVLLDIDTTLTIAPGAKTVVYDAPFNGRGSFQDVFNQMINDKVTVISNSWAYCEDQTNSADVQSIDSVLQTAAMAGITVVNGAGDNGSTCLDGSANTVAVPADSPHATAVGGTSESEAPNITYGPESWWNGAAASPQTGQGGFGVSEFFSAPAYQTGFTGAKRSVPDVVMSADPATGIYICEGDAGGCPTGLEYGGTSVAAPEWAAMAAKLNEAQGANLGLLNTQLYPLANTSAFHNAVALGSDFAHVGLGSPNLNEIYLKLTGQSAGTPSKTLSQTGVSMDTPLTGAFPAGVPADGQTKVSVVVALRDANGNAVAGKTVTLSQGAGGAVITPSSGVTTSDNGAAIFSLTDATPENLTLTATDTTDGVVLTQTPQFPFVVPPATAASINAAPTSVNNDGKATTTITVTLKDTNGNATPGKLINLLQTGSSVITGPSPQVTDAGGNIQFFATDLIAETVTYTAVDVTDLNLPIPGSGVVTFSGSPNGACGSGLPVAAPGFVIAPYATGFSAQNLSFGNVNFGCVGAGGLGFDSSGNLYVNELPTGNIYKFAPGGGAAGSGTLLNNVGVSLAGLAFDGSGNLFVSRTATTGNFTTGAVMQLDPSTGAVTRTISANLTCPSLISIDPLSGDLFTDDSCSGAGSDNPGIFRVSGPGGASPSTSTYATLPTTPNATLAFTPGGTFYVWADTEVAQVTGTNGPTTPAITVLPGIQIGNLGLLAGGAGDGTFLIGSPLVGGVGIGFNQIDLTTNPPTVGTEFANSGAYYATFGPDGCIYGSALTTVFKVIAADGTCDYGASLASPALVLSPTSVSPNPAQGTSQTFKAMLHYVSAPAGTQIRFNVAGANPQSVGVNTDATGLASFTYSGIQIGQDTVTAVAPSVGTSGLVSNQSVVTWGAGVHTTLTGIGQSPTTGTSGLTTTLTASLTDISANPAGPLSGQTIQFSVDGASCSAPTNTNGLASCQVTVGSPGSSTLTATFAGTAEFLASTASQAFNALGIAPSTTPSATPTLTATPTETATPTPTVSATPTPTATPGGDASLIEKGSGGGKPGATVDLGSFGYAASDASQQIVTSVNVSVSKPGIFSSLTLTASLGGTAIGTSTVNAPEITSTTVFTFAPPLTLPAGQGESLTFALTGVISGQTSSLDLPNQIKLAGVIGVGNSGGFGGTGNLMLALSLLGLVITPLTTKTRRRTSILVVATLFLATGLVGCNGSSNGGGEPVFPSSRQEIIALSVTENGNPVGVSGLPINLGRITKK